MKFALPKLSSLAGLLLLTCTAYAAPNDTTWVQAHANTQLNYYNDFDVPVVFPSGQQSYRKIIMEFTLGKYQCGAQEQYCGDWDYTIQNFLITPTDTLELSRLITPYANASYPRTPWTWKQRYYFDVTDFYPVLQNKATLRLAYHNYSGGFTGSIRFAFIEGTPPRRVTGIRHLWHGAFTYGKTTDPIDNHFTPLSTTVPAGSQQAALRFTVTGHGSDDNYCSEFCSKYYEVFTGSNLLQRKYIWRDNCGSNNLYPQSGTWVYNRANWCPGDQVLPNTHTINTITPGTALNATIRFQPYTGNGNASFITESILFFYSNFLHTSDASLERVIAPSDYEGDFRANPICGAPAILVKNTGSTVIQQLTIAYGIQGAAAQTDTIYNMQLAALQDTVLTLRSLSAFPSATAPWRFSARIVAVNGQADEETDNNTIQTSFTPAPEWPEQFMMVLKTNNKASESSWRIENYAGDIIKQRTPAAAQTTYTDTLTGLPDGCYRLVVTDAGCDGLYWWANTSAGRGWLYATTDNGSILPFTNGLPAYPATLSQDFGCGYTQNFRVAVTLPASQLWLTVTPGTGTNQLRWETATETNTRYFELQYADAETGFAKAATITARGNSTANSLYTSDHTPPHPSSVYYYRLKLWYTNGTYKYSNTVQVTPVVKSVTLARISPNPFTHTIQCTIGTDSPVTATIRLMDVQGHTLYHKNETLQTGYNQVVLENLTSLAGGIYLLVINAGSQQFTEKLVK